MYTTVARQFLVKTSLTSIPIMGLCWLHEGTHQRLDSARSRFFYEWVGNKKKYHMTKWDYLTSPKEFGGLGFIYTRAMDVALLAKWIYKLESGGDNLCLRLLRKKYTQGKSFFIQTKPRGMSQFWQGLHSVKEWYERGRSCLVESGAQTHFLDWYLDRRMSFQDLFP